MDIRIRGFAIGQFESSNSQRPNVSLLVVSRLLDNLWRHPERSANKGVLLRHSGRELARDAKVGQLYLSMAGQ